MRAETLAQYVFAQAADYRYDRTSRPQRIYDHRAPVNDVVIHPNQGELVSCDQAGSVKVWDLGENGCSHELVSDGRPETRALRTGGDMRWQRKGARGVLV